MPRKIRVNLSWLNSLMGCSFGCPTSKTGCVDEFGCDPNVCPDFIIRRHDTRPSFKVKIDDCDGPLDLTNLILEASMWARGKLKTAVANTDDYISLADNIGFNQIMVGDVIIIDRTRLPERMLVEGFDETNKLIKVYRGYQGTSAGTWKKGTALRIMRFAGASATTEMLLEDVVDLNGNTQTDQLMESYLIYDWRPEDTCLPGCYYLEFKLLKMIEESPIEVPSSVGILGFTPSFTSPDLTPADFGCKLGDGVEWVRRFPLTEGFLIRITDSPTMEI